MNNDNLQISGRQAKILSMFPSFMRVENPGKVVALPAQVLGNDMDEAERLLMGIQRSHRLHVAEEEKDIYRLAAILGINRADFIILRKFYENGYFSINIGNVAADKANDRNIEENAYKSYIKKLKESIVRISKVMLEGYGTIWALLEGTAVLLNAVTITDPVKGRVEHTDDNLSGGGFIHRVSVKYQIMEDKKPADKSGYIYIIENPLTDKSTEDKERRQREWFRTELRGFFDVQAAIQLTGVEERTVLPIVINKTTNDGVGFKGVVRNGQKLLFSSDGRVYMDGIDVTERCYYFHGSLINDPGWPVSESSGSFDFASPDNSYCTVDPPYSMDRGYPHTVITPLDKLHVMTLPIGDSDWRFSINEGAYNASGFDEAVFMLPEDQQALNALPPSGKVKLMWKEHEPFSVTILIPEDYKSIETGLLKGEDLRRLVRAGLERFRAAGIKIHVDYLDAKWILGKSILKSINESSGEGVDFNGTVPWDLTHNI